MSFKKGKIDLTFILLAVLVVLIVIWLIKAWMTGEL